MAMGLFLRLFFCFVLLSGVVDAARLIGIEGRTDFCFYLFEFRYVFRG